MVFTTVQLCSAKSKFRFCAGPNPTRGVSQIGDGENFWHWPRLEIRCKRLSLVKDSAKTIPPTPHHHLHYHHHHYHIDQRFQEHLPLKKAENRQMLLPILWNVWHLGRQGLAFHGSSEDQLIQLSAKNVLYISEWLERKTNKYVHGNYQNKFIRILDLFYSTTSLKTSKKVAITPVWQMK